jgi:hypothetical protein
MKLEPGYYKIKRKGRYIEDAHHYIRVYIQEGKKYIQLDNDIPEPAEQLEEGILDDFMLVKKVVRPIEVKHPVVSITWKDEDDDRFVMKARNIFALKSIFKSFPRVAKALWIK